ncbi:helix-turn-helix domain-containing protein [Anaerosporobacter faecicola]|uniref:helix-turn-helix domain-containing protein n=1 Tax=Anaerosporobacter faecicola TaxID=2718714 RepID=UPI001439B7D5|nr:helix-turn-helix transcriptional regulator [Anaerosporobacter faecicola]
MEFNEKLQQLRRDKELTQEQLAEVLYVSRTAISKWESGRGYPSIESLKAISKYFAVSIDDLLSSDELLTIAEDDSKVKTHKLSDSTLGVLDCLMALLFVLPIFGQEQGAYVKTVNMIALKGGFIPSIYWCSCIAITLWGILQFLFQATENRKWSRYKVGISILLTMWITIIFILSRQPYASIYALGIFVTKGIILLKSR